MTIDDLSRANRLERKNLSELEVAKRFIPVYNGLHETDFGDPYVPDDDVSIDVEAVRLSEDTERLSMQVTKSDSEPWPVLAKGKMFERSETGFDNVCNRLWAAIERKAHLYPSALKAKIVLLLDGWFSVHREEIDVFKTRFSEQLAATGFAQIWFVGISEDMIIKLK